MPTNYLSEIITNEDMIKFMAFPIVMVILIIWLCTLVCNYVQVFLLQRWVAKKGTEHSLSSERTKEDEEMEEMERIEKMYNDL